MVDDLKLHRNPTDLKVKDPEALHQSVDFKSETLMSKEIVLKTGRSTKMSSGIGIWQGIQSFFDREDIFVMYGSKEVANLWAMRNGTT